MCNEEILLVQVLPLNVKVGEIFTVSFTRNTFRNSVYFLWLASHLFSIVDINLWGRQAKYRLQRDRQQDSLAIKSEFTQAKKYSTEIGSKNEDFFCTYSTHCFICHHSESIVSEGAGSESWTSSHKRILPQRRGWEGAELMLNQLVAFAIVMIISLLPLVLFIE
jgi:hypothetical protein